MVGDARTWLIIFVILNLANTFLKLLRLMYNLVFIIFNPRPIDLKKKYGEWAGNVTL